ncbi:hypothetical protein [Qipengyuania flava]|uniref:hypothetical protein n=1 Tax=Qipengyuania flava TaxID=192812 RepID=UPI00273E7F1C|nr:hypothetical protein [Qipengyuania flava]
MIDLPNIHSIEAVLDQPLDKTLKGLLQDRLADTIQCGLQDYTHVLVVQDGDTEQQVVEAIGFSPLKTRIEGRPDCVDWDWCEQHPGWWELLYTVGDDGFAYILLVEDAERLPLAKLCRSEGPSR